MMDSNDTMDWSSETNWTIASGSLRNCLTFETSLPLHDRDVHEPDATTSNSLPLLLHSPSPDSAPCEINISFAEKHEIRQVYVRSTARVYEIYTAPNLKSNNEYLCTVRCGVAARDGEVLCAPSIQEVASLHVGGSNKELGEENIKNEDDWVEVKVPDSPVLDGRNIPLQTNSYTNSTKSSQDFFEATAEINDANPCISVTLRLLSLQSKGCVYVDEIYVFGDPVDSADSESQESHNGNSSASSLMAMFLPTIMQLPKTTGLSHLNAVRKEKQSISEDNSEKTHQSDSVIQTQLKGKASITDPQEVKSKEENGGWVGPSQPDPLSQVVKKESDHTAVPSQAAKLESNHNVVPSQIAEVENNHSAVPVQIAESVCSNNAVHYQVAYTENNHGNSMGGNVERALEQLVSRIDRIEEICLGFQEKMVMPMSSIEARLQRVEQQLDMLNKKLQSYGRSCCRISAPDASCIESDANSIDNGLGFTVDGKPEPDNNDLQEEVISVTPDDISDSANATQLLPGLVVTAPEFPDSEDEEDEEDNVSGEEMNPSNDKGKRSIDDALSSALATFVSSLSLDSPKYTKRLTVKAPEFSIEDVDDHESNSEVEKNDSFHLTHSKKTNHIQVLTSADISLESGEKVDIDSDAKHSEETAQEAGECGQFCSAEGDLDNLCVKTSIVADHNSRTDFKNDFEEDKSGMMDCHKIDGLSPNPSDTSNELHGYQTSSGSSTAQEGPSARTDLTVAKEVPKKASHEDIIENVLGLSLSSPVVDFQIPLLDVEFVSQRSHVIDPFFEAFLVDKPETDSQDPPVEESIDDLPIKEELKTNGDLSVEGLSNSNLVSLDNVELVKPASDSHITVEKDYCTLVDVPVNIEGDNQPQDHKRKHNQIFTSSLI